MKEYLDISVISLTSNFHRELRLARFRRAVISKCAKLGRCIRFLQGLPKYNDDLGDIEIGFNHILVLDDLMLQAKDSAIASKLFTQGRHRNASVILLMLQNA